MDQVFIITVLCAVIYICEVLVRTTKLKYFGTALLAILFTAIIANLGIIPTSSTPDEPVPIYDFIFSILAPLSILWLLLQANLKDILKAGIPIIILFLIGSLGTALGVIIGMNIINGPESIGPLFYALGGMFTGTYSGGSVNFNAVALHYDVMNEGILYAGTVVVDNIITAVWMVLCIAIPRILSNHWPGKSNKGDEIKEVDLGISEDTETIHPKDLAMTFILGFGTLYLSNQIEVWSEAIGFGIPSIISLTIIALVLAQVPFVNKLQGPRLMGLFAVYLFLSVIGAYCDIAALGKIGSLGISLLILAAIIIIVHALVLFSFSRIFKMDLDQTAVASQANIGGGTSALALARSLGRKDLVLPAVLIGTLGNALGTFLGFWVAGILQ